MGGYKRYYLTVVHISCSPWPRRPRLPCEGSARSPPAESSLFTQILAMAARSSGGAYPLTFLSGSSRCISALQLGTKEDGICQHGAPTLRARVRGLRCRLRCRLRCAARRGEMACGVRAGTSLSLSLTSLSLSLRPSPSPSLAHLGAARREYDALLAEGLLVARADELDLRARDRVDPRLDHLPHHLRGGHARSRVDSRRPCTHRALPAC